MALGFTWDARKAAGNLRKHGVAFDEATTVFLDPVAGTISDTEHSQDKERLVTIGMSNQARLIVVVHADKSEFVIRLISARLATPRERKAYERG